MRCRREVQAAVRATTEAEEAMSAGSYAAAMAADRARLASAQKRNLEQASLHGEEEDAVQGAWDSVLRGGQQQAAESEEEVRKKKAQKKSDKRNAKRAETAANAGSLSLYVSGIPKELSFNAVQNLFSKAGKVSSSSSSSSSSTSSRRRAR